MDAIRIELLDKLNVIVEQNGDILAPAKFDETACLCKPLPRFCYQEGDRLKRLYDLLTFITAESFSSCYP